MMGPGQAAVFSFVPVEIKEEMKQISKQNRDWPQAEIIREAIMRFMPELRKELASEKDRFHSTLGRRTARRLRLTQVSPQREDANTQVVTRLAVTRLIDTMEQMNERLERLEERNKAASENHRA